ncbi:MAG TPA: hypothetical protein VMT51_00830 [Dongiaceae bacterium]|nr:hypothetical protein [Dongiaceae bacterium]
MEQLNELAVLGGATLLAAAAAFGMAWAFLRGAFRLMLPAGRVAARPALVIGTRAAARGFVVR